MYRGEGRSADVYVPRLSKRCQSVGFSFKGVFLG